MPIKFNIVGRGNPAKPEAPKKYYPSIQSTGRMTMRELAEKASHMSTLSTVDMMAAIEIFLAIIPDELASGKVVELGDFSNFWLRSTSEGQRPPKKCAAIRSPASSRALCPVNASNACWMRPCLKNSSDRSGNSCAQVWQDIVKCPPRHGKVLPETSLCLFGFQRLDFPILRSNPTLRLLLFPHQAWAVWGLLQENLQCVQTNGRPVWVITPH